jgi:hypothetical protein
MNQTHSKAFAAALADLGARHKVTHPFRPQTNGKAERFNQTLLAEWAYVRRYDTNQTRLEALPAFVEQYNERRPHGSLDGETPMSVLVNNVSGITARGTRSGVLIRRSLAICGPPTMTNRTA